MNKTTGPQWFNEDWIEFESVIGSQAYGLAHEDSDTDLRGWYLPPIEHVIGLNHYDEQVSINDPESNTEAVYYDVGKFIRLALNANPNILEILWSPRVTYSTPIGQELLSRRNWFLSQKLRTTHMGYAVEQLNKAKNHPEAPWKHLMHLIRLLRGGITAFETGQIQVEIDDPYDRRLLKQIRAGAWPMETVEFLYESLFDRFKTAAAENKAKLPAEGNFEAANDFLIELRKHSWNTRKQS